MKQSYKTYIEKWYKGVVLFTVYAIQYGKEIDLTVKREAFEEFVDRHDKRDWFEDKNRLATWEEYYDSEYPEKDLIEFIDISSFNYYHPCSPVRILNECYSEPVDIFGALGEIFKPTTVL